MTAAAEGVGLPYELVFVNDGSPDASARIAAELVRGDSRVRLVDLSRNFGHHAAILAGLRHSRGAFVFLIDVDLEERPEWLPGFWEDMRSAPADVVYGVQTARAGGPFKRHSGSLFYLLFNALSDIRIPPNGCTVRLMTRRYVDAISRLGEAHVFLAGLFSWVGFEQRPRYVAKSARESGSTYTPIRLLRLSVNALTSFSSYPLTVVFFIGMLLTGVSLGYAGWLFALKVRNPQMVLSGFTSVMVSLWLLGGAILSVLGLIGMYVGKIFVETKDRPQYVVRRILEGSGASGDD